MADLQLEVVDGKIELIVAGSDLIEPYVAAASASADRAEAGAAAADTSAANAGEAEAQALVYAEQALAAAGNGGYFYHPDTLTRFKYMIVDGEVQPVIVPHIYLDPINGNDAWDGLHGARVGATTQGPIKTSAAFYAHSLFGAGVVLAIKRGPEDMRDTIDLAEPNTGNGGRTLSQFSVVDYGTGPLRRINCTDIAANGSFTAHATISGAYEISWTHKLWAVATARIRVFENGEPLHRVSTEAGTSVAGTYWYDGSLDPTGAAERVVIHPWAGDSAITNGKTYEITRRQYAVSGRDNVYIQGLHGYANGHNNGSFFCYDNPTWSTLICEQGTKHNWCAGPGLKQDVISVNTLDATEDYGAEGGLLAVTFLGDVSGKTDKLVRVGAIIDASMYAHSVAGSGSCQPFYTHSVGGNPLALCTFQDCWDNNTANTPSMTANQVIIDRHFGGLKTTSAGGIVQGLGTFNNITVTNSVCVGSRRAINVTNTGTVIVDRCYFNSYPVAGQPAIYGAGYPNANITITNCIFSDSNNLSNVIQLDPLGSKITIRNNIFCKVFAGYTFGAETGAAVSIDIDFNHYTRYDGTDLGAGRYFALYKGTSEAFATWQGHGFDTHSIQHLGPGSFAGFVAGVDPDQHGDVRLSPTGAAYPLITNPLTYAEVQDIMNKPLTLAAAKTFMQSSVSHLPVFVA